MQNKNNKKTHVVAGRQNWHFRVVDEIIRRQLWVSPKKTCAVIKILEISRRVVWEVVNLKFAININGVREGLGIYTGDLLLSYVCLNAACSMTCLFLFVIHSSFLKFYEKYVEKKVEDKSTDVHSNLYATRVEISPRYSLEQIRLGIIMNIFLNVGHPKG